MKIKYLSLAALVLSGAYLYACGDPSCNSETDDCADRNTMDSSPSGNEDTATDTEDSDTDIFDAFEPSQPVDLSITALKASAYWANSYVIDDKGDLFGAGNNSTSQIKGNDPNVYRAFIRMNQNIRDFAAGNSFVMYLGNNGVLTIIGSNAYGQLGIGEQYKDLKGASHNDLDVKVLAASHRTAFFINESQQLYGMGENIHGQLCLGHDHNRFTPTLLASEVKAVAAGSNHTLFIKEDGSVWGCGDNSSHQLGEQAGGQLMSKELEAVEITGLSNISQVFAGNESSFFLSSSGELWVLGANAVGQLGLAGGTAVQVPAKVMDQVKKVSMGDGHTLVLKDDGSLFASGLNDERQLGTDNRNNLSEFTQIADDILDMAAGGRHSLIIKKDGSVWSIGSNGSGQIGSDNPSASVLEWEEGIFRSE